MVDSKENFIWELRLRVPGKFYRHSTIILRTLPSPPSPSGKYWLVESLDGYQYVNKQVKYFQNCLNMEWGKYYQRTQIEWKPLKI